MVWYVLMQTVSQYPGQCEKLYDPVLVIGTGRSGTSIVAGMLYRMGVYMGEYFRPPDEHNPFGYYEDRDFNSLFNKAATDNDELDFRLNLERLIITRRAMYRPWGIKDPKITDCLEIFLLYFSNAKFIVCKRNKTDCVKSILNQTRSLGRSKEWAEGCYDQRKEIIEHLLNDQKVLEIEFDQLLEDPETIAKQILLFVYHERIIAAKNSLKSRTEIEKIKREYAHK